MRSIFVKTFSQIAKKDPRIIFLTGDLGFNAFEKMQRDLGSRFINAGVAEHNMVTAAAGMAYAGFNPWIYSIAPFVSIKVLEEIRNDICFSKRNVKIVGLGGGYDYAIAGPTHHALQDVACILTLPDIKVYTPGFVEDVPSIVSKMYKEDGPSYLRLTRGQKINIKLSSYSACRRVLTGNKLTVIALGSIIYKVLEVAGKYRNKIDLWLISELPVNIQNELIKSIKKTNNLLIVEEHVRTGGLGHYMGGLLSENKIKLANYIHLYAKGYISGRYGSRDFYLKESGLDSESIADSLRNLL